MITEVRVKLVDSGPPGPNDGRTTNDKLLAFCTITINRAFVIRDLKIIGSPKGPFIAMPSRKLMDKCTKCSGKNHLRSRYCNECGGKLNPTRADVDDRGRAKLHADIAHPINPNARELLHKAVMEAYEKEYERSQQEGYIPAKWEDDTDY